MWVKFTYFITVTFIDQLFVLLISKNTCKNYTLVQAHILFMEILLNIKFPLFFLRKIYTKRCCGIFVKNVPSDKKMK